MRSIAVFSVLTIFVSANVLLADDRVCDAPAAHCASKLEPRCLNRIGAGSLAANVGDCESQLTEYRTCLSQTAAQCGGARQTQRDAAEARAAFDAVASTTNPAELEIVAEIYPNTVWGKLAAEKARALRQSAESERTSVGVASSENDVVNPQNQDFWSADFDLRRFSGSLPCRDEGSVRTLLFGRFFDGVPVEYTLIGSSTPNPWIGTDMTNKILTPDRLQFKARGAPEQGGGDMLIIIERRSDEIMVEMRDLPGDVLSRRYFCSPA